MDNDTELLRRYTQQRDEPAFADFVSRNLPLVYSAALRRLDGNTAAAADVAQLVFTQVSQRAGALAQHPCLPGWLYSATRRTAANFARAERRRRFWEAKVAHMDTETQDTVIPNWEKIRPQIDSAMDGLRESDREAVLLRFFCQLSFAEVGAKLALSENAARMRVDRALEKLRERLRKRGIVSTTAALALVLGNEAIASIPAPLAATITAGAATSTVATTTSIVVTTFTVMKHAKLIATAAAIVASIGFGLHQMGETKKAKAELALANQRISDTRKQAKNMEKQLAESANDLANTKAQLTALRKKTPDAQPEKAESVAAKPRIFSDPHYARVYMEQYQKSLPVKYAALFHALNLTPGQVAQFENAMMECQRNIVEIWSAAEQQNLPTDHSSAASTAVARMTVDPIAARDEVLKSILGIDGLQQFQSFDAPPAAVARDTFGTLSAAFYSAAVPLTAAQGDQLSRIIGANTAETKTPMASDGGAQMYVISAQTDWDAVLASAQPTLSAAQLVTFRAAIEQQRSAETLKNFSFTAPNSGNPSTTQ